MECLMDGWIEFGFGEENCFSTFGQKQETTTAAVKTSAHNENSHHFGLTGGCRRDDVAPPQCEEERHPELRLAQAWQADSRAN